MTSCSGTAADGWLVGGIGPPPGTAAAAEGEVALDRGGGGIACRLGRTDGCWTWIRKKRTRSV